MATLLDKVPGLRKAVEQEQFIRHVSFLPVNESIEGFPVKPLTLRHLLVLRLQPSPLLSGTATPSPLDLVAFLWLLNPGYTPDSNSPAKKQFLKLCRSFIPSSNATAESPQVVAAAKLVMGCRQYVTEAFQDIPARKGNVEFEP